MGDTGHAAVYEFFMTWAAPSEEAMRLQVPVRLRAYVEIWNLVFMQFNRDASGSLTELPNHRLTPAQGSSDLHPRSSM